LFSVYLYLFFTVLGIVINPGIAINQTPEKQELLPCCKIHYKNNCASAPTASTAKPSSSSVPDDSARGLDKTDELLSILVNTECYQH